MATPDAVAAIAEIASSLAMDDIPVKLRCAVCNRLAIDAVRMPCCDQSVCETCQASLTDECPICLLNPVDRSMCTPNKALRTTIKAFLRKKGIEKEASKKRERMINLASDSTTSAVAGTPDGNPTGITNETEINTNGQKSYTETTQELSGVKSSAFDVGIQQTSTEAQMDIPRPSIENASDNLQVEVLQGAIKDGTELGMGGQDDHEAGQRGQNDELHKHNGQWSTNGGAGQGMPDGVFGFNGMTGGFPNMNFNGASDLSQMMQFMPNGMPNNLMGTFPNMMGMPGMGMDPMAMSQAMYGGFGGQGMGMNGMNMGMGMSAAQGAFGGFTGQPESWITGQDKFNPNAYGGHANGMGADFGNHVGYGGYNVPSQQGSFNQMHHQQFPNNDFQNGYNGQGFQNRGRGRRGAYYNTGRGRGGYNQVNQGNQGNQANYEPFHHQIPSQNVQQSISQQPQQHQPLMSSEQQPTESAKQEVDTAEVVTSQSADEQMNKELNPGDEDDKAVTDTKFAQTDTIVPTTIELVESIPDAPPILETAEPVEQVKVDEITEAKPSPIETFISSDHELPGSNIVDEIPKDQNPMLPPPSPAIPLGPAAHYSQNHSQEFSVRGRGSIRGFYRGATDTRGGFRGRGAGPVPNGHNVYSNVAQSIPTSETSASIPAALKGLGVEGAPKGPKAFRDGLPNTGLRGGLVGGRGFSIVGRASAAAQARPNGVTRSKSPSPSRRRSRSRSRSHSRDSRHRSSHHRSYRHRSKSISEESEHDKRKERHHRHSRKHDDEGIDGAQDVDETRKRDTSPDSLTKRSSHRSHRNHERDSASSNHRHRRDRSRDRDEERRHRRRRSRSGEQPTPTSATYPEPVSRTSSRRRDKDESRKRRDRDDDDRHSDRKRSRRDHSASSDNGYRSSRHKRDRDELTSRAKAPDKQHVENLKAVVAPEPEKDHHTLEREARNRERLQRELQRREAIEGKGPQRKDRDSKAEGRLGRRVSYKYEDEEGDETRARRVERERESGRWG